MLINRIRLRDSFLKFSSRITKTLLNINASIVSFHPSYLIHGIFALLLVMRLTGEDDSLALKKKVTIEDVFGPDLHIHDPDAKWLSGE